jgi:glutamate-1-semialdehyde 2,1-aminomutase
MSTPDDLMQAYAARRPKSLQYHERARKVLAGGVGHDLRHFQPVPLYIDRARGARKWDVDGNEYIDFLMGNAALLLGHADPEVVAAVAQATGKGSHFGTDHPLHVEWAECVCRLIPSAERVRFVNSGTEATALAFRIARGFTGRPKILRFEGYFHGWHDEVMHGFQPPFDADGSLGIPASVRANLVSLPAGDLDRLASVLAQDKAIAAVIIEPSGGSWGRIPVEAAFLRGLRDVTQQHGVLLIFDEVITGFRWSPGGAQQRLEIKPDLTCLAKILAGGLPGGAVAGRADVMKVFDFTGEPQHDRFGRVGHQGTFNASPPSAAAGIVTLRRLVNGEPIVQADRMADLLRRSWDQVLQQHHVAGYVYGPASTFHVYFETDRQRLAGISQRKDLPTRDANRLKGMPGALIARYQLHLRHRGVDIMSSTGGVLSASHTEQEVAQATTAFDATVVALLEEKLISTL